MTTDKTDYVSAEMVARLSALVLFFLSGAGFAALVYSHASELHGPSVMAGILMVVCAGAFSVRCDARAQRRIK